MNNMDNLIELVRIPRGKFLMGAAPGEKEVDNDEYPQHSVMVPEFYLGKYQVTQAQWRDVATGLPKIEHDLDSDPSEFKGDTYPVERVSWREAVEFCKRLSQATGRNYRLPSEAEWEYACRAGTTTPFYFGDTLSSELANYDAIRTYGEGPEGEYREQTTPVGSFPANNFGLYDMHGNAWEWCADDWHDNYEGAPTDGSPWDGEGIKRVLRGGSWVSLPKDCRSAVRNYDMPDYAHFNYGFRVACAAPRTLS